MKDATLRRRRLLTWLAKRDLMFVEAADFAARFGYCARATQRDLHALCDAGLAQEATPWRPGCLSRERRSADHFVTTAGWELIPTRSRPRQINLGHYARAAHAHGWQVQSYAQDAPFDADMVLAHGEVRLVVVFDDEDDTFEHYSPSRRAASLSRVLAPAGAHVVKAPHSPFSGCTPSGQVSMWPPTEWNLPASLLS